MLEEAIPGVQSSEGTGFSFEIATQTSLTPGSNTGHVARERASRLRLQPRKARFAVIVGIGSEGTGFSFEIATRPTQPSRHN